MLHSMQPERKPWWQWGCYSSIKKDVHNTKTLNPLLCGSNNGIAVTNLEILDLFSLLGHNDSVHRRDFLWNR